MFTREQQQRSTDQTTVIRYQTTYIQIRIVNEEEDQTTTIGESNYSRIKRRKDKWTKLPFRENVHLCLKIKLQHVKRKRTRRSNYNLGDENEKDQTTTCGMKYKTRRPNYNL